MLTFILIPAITLCFLQIFIQSRKMNEIERHIKQPKLNKTKKNNIFDT